MSNGEQDRQWEWLCQSRLAPEDWEWATKLRNKLRALANFDEDRAKDWSDLLRNLFANDRAAISFHLIELDELIIELDPTRVVDVGSLRSQFELAHMGLWAAFGESGADKPDDEWFA